METTEPVLPLVVTRIRHELTFRMLQVVRVRDVTPTLRCVTLAGDDLAGFTSASFDDHVKVFFPAPGQDKPSMPLAGPNGPVFDERHPRPVARDFTPRRYDAVAGELDIEFCLHGVGPATTWAAQASAGQYLGIGRPRGSLVIPAGYDWHLLIGDESALPAIARRVEELGDHANVGVIAEVGTAASALVLPARQGLTVQWCWPGQTDAGGGHIKAGDALMAALWEWTKPSGQGYVWAAGESSVIRTVRRYLVDERGIDKSGIRAASYWRAGADATHEVFDD